MRQHGLYGKEREELLKEVKKLLEGLERGITVFGRSPELLPLEEELPVLASHGFFSSFRDSGDFGATLVEVLPRLCLPSRVASLLSQYAESFGRLDRAGEERVLSHLFSRLSPTVEEEVGVVRTQVRTFRVVTVAMLLSVAILLC